MKKPILSLAFIPLMLWVGFSMVLIMWASQVEAQGGCTPAGGCSGCSEDTDAACKAAMDGEGGSPFKFERRPINLMQPLGSKTTLDPEPGIGVFFTYFNDIWPYIIGIAAGIAVLQALVGGVQIMLSANGGMKEEGKSRIQWALAGLLLIGLSGAILEMINPIFFKQV
jgi:hypothetical protein